MPPGRATTDCGWWQRACVLGCAREKVPRPRLFFLMIRRPPRSTLFPYPPLFRSIFSCADAFLFKPLPLPGIQRMLVLFEQPPGRSSDWNAVAPANYLDWTRQSRSFQSLAAYDWTDFNLSGQGDPERVLGARVSLDFFSTLGVKAALGRTFFPEENEPGRE